MSQNGRFSCRKDKARIYKKEPEVKNENTRAKRHQVLAFRLDRGQSYFYGRSGNPFIRYVYIGSKMKIIAHGLLDPPDEKK